MLSAGIGAYIYYTHFLNGNIFDRNNIKNFFKNKFSNNIQTNNITSNKEESLTINKYEGIENYSSIPLIKVSLSTILSHKKTSLLVVLSIITYKNRNKVKKGIALVKKYMYGKKTDEDIETIKKIKQSIEKHNVIPSELVPEPPPKPQPEPDPEPEPEPESEPEPEPEVEVESQPVPQPPPKTASPSSNSDSGSSIHSTGEIINHPMDSVDNGKEKYICFTDWLSNIKL